MTEIYIHIGLQKTGSSFLQQNYFPKVSNVNYFNYFNFKNFGSLCPNNKYLISHEGICGTPWNEEWRSGQENSHHWKESFEVSVKNLKNLFPTAHIIIVFRRHGDLVLSLYKQYLHEGGILPLKDFYTEKGILRKEDLNFKNRISLLRENFNQVDILSFDQFKILGPSYYIKYFKTLGFEEVELDDKKNVNRGVSGKKIELLRRYNILYLKSPKLLRKILFKTGFNPRQVFQNRLAVWNTRDSEKLMDLKDKINAEFEEDWKFIVENKI